MTRRLIAVLLLALPATAFAKGLIIVPPGALWIPGDSWQLASLKTELIRSGQREGYEFFIRNARLVPTDNLRRGVFYDGPSDSTLVDWVWVVGFTTNRFGAYGACYDSVTMVGASGAGQRTFTTKPVVFSPRMTTRQFFGTGPVCSLGVYNVGVTEASSSPGADTTMSAYAVNNSWIWKLKTPSYQKVATMKAGQWRRQRICLGSSLSQTYCRDCDSLPTRAANDTMVVWEYAVATPGTVIATATESKTVAPILCMLEGGGQTNDGDAGTMLQTLAILDSLTAGKVFERHVATTNADFAPGLPIQASAIILNGYQTGGETFASTAAFQGLRLGSLTIAKQQADSLNKLRCKPTVVTEWDSLTANNWQDAIWSRIADAHYGIGGDVGRTNEKSFGNCSATRVMDPIGRSRARAAFGDKSGAGADTSVHGNFKNIVKLMKTRFGERFEPLLSFSGVWSPTSVATMTDDSLYAAIAENGINTWSVTGPALPYGPAAGELINWPRRYVTRYGFSPDTARGVRALSTYGGKRLRMVLEANTSSIGADRWANNQNSVSVASAYGQGWIAWLALGRYFIVGNGGLGVQVDEQPCKILAVTAGGMGTGDLPGGIAGQWTYRSLKQVDNVMDYANAAAWPTNRPIFEWVYPSQLR